MTKSELVISQETMRMIGDAVRDTYRADLRAKVEALPDAHHYGTQQGGHVQRSDVLSLIDGSSDE